MKPMNQEGPHLEESELLNLAMAVEGAEREPRIDAHLNTCDWCLVRLADMRAGMAGDAATAASLRAVNVAAARWRSELARFGVGEEIHAAPASRQERFRALLGRFDSSDVVGATPGAEVHSPLLTLFVGKRQSRA